MAEGVLTGMRLVEVSAFVAAPLGGMTLAQMGADVIRIDTIKGGLDYRRWPVTNDNVSLFWCGLNKSKRSVALNLDTVEGREIAINLIASPGEDSGMLLTNFPPRGWLDYSKLKERRDDLIQLTLMGDRHGASAVDYTINARVGVTGITGPSDINEPVNHVLPAWDLITGQMVAVGLLAAERHRRRTGQGQHVKLSLEDVALSVMGHLGFLAESQLGQERERHGNELFGAFGRDFCCQDGKRLMVVGLTLKQWQSIVKAMDLGEAMTLLGQQLKLNLSLEGDRFQARREIAKEVQRWVGAHTLEQAAAILDKHGACWGRYQSIHELVNSDPSCSPANPMFSHIEQSGVGRLLAPAIALDFSEVQRLPASGAPKLGEHTEQVLVELLGLSNTDFCRLHDDGIVMNSSSH